MHLSTQNLLHLHVTGATHPHKVIKHISNNHKDQISALLKIKAEVQISAPVYFQFKQWVSS
jgi:hypothetical protein